MRRKGEYIFAIAVGAIFFFLASAIFCFYFPERTQTIVLKSEGDDGYVAGTPEEKKKYEVTRFYKIEPYHLYMTPYNKELERTTILSRAQRYADSAEVTIKQTDMDYFIVSITLLYESQSDVPGMEDQDEIFGSITSTGLVEAVIHYGEEEQETVFDNRDIELSEMTYGDDGFHLYLSLTKEDFAEVSRKMANEEVNILLDGEVVASETLPVDKTGKKVETNYMKFKIDSYDRVLKLRALSETIPLKYEVERVNWE